jgi:hypothetical protein
VGWWGAGTSLWWRVDQHSIVCRCELYLMSLVTAACVLVGGVVVRVALCMPADFQIGVHMHLCIYKRPLRTHSFVRIQTPIAYTFICLYTNIHWVRIHLLIYKHPLLACAQVLIKVYNSHRHKTAVWRPMHSAGILMRMGALLYYR